MWIDTLTKIKTVNPSQPWGKYESLDVSHNFNYE